MLSARVQPTEPERIYLFKLVIIQLCQGARISDLQEPTVVLLLHLLSWCLHDPCLLGLEESDTCAGYPSRAHYASRDPRLCHHDHHGTCVHLIPAVRHGDKALQRSGAWYVETPDFETRGHSQIISHSFPIACLD